MICSATAYPLTVNGGRMEAMISQANLLIDGALETVLIVDRDGRVVYANPSAGSLLGVSPQDLVGRQSSTLLTDLNARRCSAQQLPLHAGNGELLGRLLVLRPVMSSGKSTRTSETDGMSGRLLRALTRLDPRDQRSAELMPAILAIVCRETGWPVGHVFVPDSTEPRQLVSAGFWHLSDVRFEDFRRVTRGIRFRAGEGLPGLAMEQQRPVWMSDVNLDAAFVRAALTSKLGILAGIAIPVYLRRRLVAVFEFFDTHAIRPDAAMLATLEGVARQIGLLLEYRQQRAELVEFAYSDALTGAGNRRRFDDALDAMYSLARKGIPCTVCVFDMDRFKSINDRFGHAEGDRVLVEITQLVRGQLRAQDVLARIGGEEFAVAMFGTRLQDACRVAEMLRRSIPSHVRLREGESVTASFGLAQVDPARDAKGAMTLGRADESLYQAKRSGRNKVIVSP